MAFVRRKKMHGKHYYQLVRNYREGGKHRQKVLCHLGVHDSIEAAIADAQQQVVHYEKGAASSLEKAHRIEAELKDRYGDEYEIMDERQAHYKLDRLSWNDPRYKIPHYTPYYFDEPDWDQIREDWDMEVQEVSINIAYHDAMREAEGYRVRSTRSRDRLDKLLKCRRKYFQQQEQAADRERDELRELLTHSTYRATLPPPDTPVEVIRAQQPDRTESPRVNRDPSRRKIVGRKVLFLRMHEWLQQEELAERAGVSHVTISEIERGRRPFPQRRTVLALAKALGVAPKALVTRD